MADDDELIEDAPEGDDEPDEELDVDLEDDLDPAFEADEVGVETDDVEDAEDDDDAKASATPGKSAAARPDDDDEEDDFDADDVEEDLDKILRDRIAAGTDEEDEEDEVALDTEDRTNSANRVPPKRPEEFVCQSCFLVKHPSQLADAKHQLCADCV